MAVAETSAPIGKFAPHSSDNLSLYFYSLSVLVYSGHLDKWRVDLPRGNADSSKNLMGI